MTFRIALFLLPLFLFGARIARSQLSLATCKGEDYVWVSTTGRHARRTGLHTVRGCWYDILSAIQLQEPVSLCYECILDGDLSGLE